MSDLLDLVVIELNFRKQKWLLLSIYISSINRSLFYEQMSSVIDYYSQSYKNIVLMGDFNTQPNDKNFQAIYQSHDLYNLIKNKTCFKSPSETCIDLIFTNKKRSFRNTCAIDTGVSDFHRMVFTQLKLTFQKLPPKTIFYRDYKHSVKENFENDFIVGLLNNPHVSYSYTQSSLTFESVLSIHVPIEQGKVRGTQMPFMTKALRRAIMRRSRLFSIFTESKKRSDWENFRKQQNYCVRLRNQVRKAHFNKLQNTDADNKKFWKTIGPFFSQKFNKRAKKSHLRNKMKLYLMNAKLQRSLWTILTV